LANIPPTNCRRGRTGNVEHVELADQIRSPKMVAPVRGI